jgi:hypothetical protein
MKIETQPNARPNEKSQRARFEFKNVNMDEGKGKSAAAFLTGPYIPSLASWPADNHRDHRAGGHGDGNDLGQTCVSVCDISATWN